MNQIGQIVSVTRNHYQHYKYLYKIRLPIRRFCIILASSYLTASLFLYVGLISGENIEVLLMSYAFGLMPMSRTRYY